MKEKSETRRGIAGIGSVRAKQRHNNNQKIENIEQSKNEELGIITVVPTKSRPALLEKALMSVAEQTRPPNELIIVGEQATDFPSNKRIIEKKLIDTKIHWLLNARTKNLSGSINTAVQFLISEGINPYSTYLALLDDDDLWESGYLQTAYEQLIKGNKDLVISGIIRHNTRNDVGIKQTIPNYIDQKMFLTGNPHIQGSNLFVKMSTFLRAGGFDENLPSTTDRDFMTRALDLGDITYASTGKHLVHHYADLPNRLSTYGSEAKITGLTRFFQKYKDRMTNEEILQFKQRATNLFGWTETAAEKETTPLNIPTPTIGKTTHKFHLTIGFTVSHLSCASKLMQDLESFQKNFPQPISLVILDNTGTPKLLQQIIQANKSSFYTIRIIPEGEVEKDAQAGKLGTFYISKERRKGPSFGRTALHRYLYLTGMELEKPVFWILDDDVRIDRIYYASNCQTITPAQFAQILGYLLEKKIAISVGGIMGDPPLPIACSTRGQLLELNNYLRSYRSNKTPEKEANTDAIAQKFPDQYYDLSINYYNHLETPVKSFLNRRNRDFTISQGIDALLEGKNLLRPSLPCKGENKMRGGNTIVTDIECLRTYPNCSPRINGIETRRGDTIWVELNRYLGGEMVGKENKQVISLPLFLKQERAPTFKPKLLSNSLAADLLGGAFVRALTDLIKTKNEIGKEAMDIGDALAFSKEDCQRVIAETTQNLERRKAILIMSAWRISGLIQTIEHQINSDNFAATTLNQNEVNQLEAVLDWIQQEISVRDVTEFCQKLKNGLNEGISQYLLEYKRNRQQFSSDLNLEPTKVQDKIAQKLIQKHFGVTSVELIGQGQEGLVYSDGSKAYKYFISNRFQRKVGLLDLIKNKLNASAHLRRIVTIENIIVEGNQVLLRMPLIEGNHYSGGRINEILEFLRECKETGIVTTNIWPENLIVGKNGLVYVDIGRSIAPYQENLFNEMCKRAFLTYRWHFRPDLKELLTKSLYETNMPELFGFEEFKKAIKQIDVHTQMDKYLIKACLKSKPKRVLDFGCGTGAIADKLAENGSDVDCYDPDPTRFTIRPHKQTVTLLSEEDLKSRIEAHQNYDLVLCNLVLCSIESENEVQRTMHKLRALTSQSGSVIIGICNPLSDEVKTSPSQSRTISSENKYHMHYPITEITPKGKQRTDWHRPISWYVHLAHKAGLEIKETIEVPSVDIERLSPSSDQILLVLQPIQRPKQTKTVSLMIKASGMEWQTIEKQVKHIVSQLEGPQEFFEKILVTDNATVGFARQYSTVNLEKFQQALQKLVNDHLIDRVISAPTDENEIKQIYVKWFGVECSKPRAINGQPTYMTLYGLDQCKGDYVLQTDCDCIFFRCERSNDYLREMVHLFESDPTAVTVALPISYKETQPYKKENENKPFRVEVRCCLLNMAKLKSMLPLKNETQNNQLKLPWHRILDLAIQEGKASSYRVGNPQTCFVHVPNFRKTDTNDWMSIIDAAEAGSMIPQQLNNIQIVGEAADWLGKRNEEMIILMRGRNVPLSKIRRCVESLQAQSFKDWSAVIIDASSSNGHEELFKYTLKNTFGDKVTYVHNHVLMSPMENIDYVTSSICTNPQSIIVHLDLDDALIGTDALNKVKEAYQKGADVTVGSMLRTDKQTEYKVTFQSPRENRGGNIWQHLRTYRKHLYDRVPKDYFQIDGGWVKHGEDWAFMIPIAELAKKPVQIKDKVYFYEPSEDKPNRNVDERERLIAKIIDKPSLENLN
ncbi:MAG: glycosyltransferase [Candidatus Bathyarchaeia archaeon]|jgi:SAM-dependent methyltransferase